MKLSFVVRLRRHLTALAFGGFSALSFGATSSHPIACDTGVEIVVQPWYDNLPDGGMVPVTVRITNHTANGGQWDMSAVDSDYRGSSMTSHFGMNVPAGATSNSTFLVTLSPNSQTSGFGYKNLRLSINGPSVKGFGGVTLNSRLPTGGRSSSSTIHPTGFIVLGERFESAHGAIFKGLSGRVSYEWMGDSADMTKAPTDWRGYSALEQLWMLDSEWTALSEQQKQGVLTWVGAGGKVFIVGEMTANSTPLPEGIKWNDGVVRIGMGWLREIPKYNIDSAIVKWSTDKNGVSKLVKQPGESSRLATFIPPLVVNGVLIFVFIVVFGVTVGPINLFWLARGNNRPRLFWTTPLISLLGALVLVVVMLLQDGTGGAGTRVMFATLAPDLKQMVLVQEQYSKTGVLLGRGFELPEHESTWLSPLPIIVQKKGRYGNTEEITEKRAYTLAGLTAGGGWFASRAVQSHIIHCIRLNRSGIELIEGDSTAEVVSSLPTPLTRLYVVDSKQQYWTADHVATGRKVALTKCKKEEFTAWIDKDVKTKMGSYLNQRIADSENPAAGWFFAQAGEPERLAVPTLNTIRWADERAYMTGPVTAGR